MIQKDFMNKLHCNVCNEIFYTEDELICFTLCDAHNVLYKRVATSGDTIEFKNSKDLKLFHRKCFEDCVSGKDWWSAE